MMSWSQLFFNKLFQFFIEPRKGEYLTNSHNNGQQRSLINLKITWPYMSDYGFIYNDSRLK
jgi:hypothetical protein